mmetsp:Transcript_8398/g.22418  ORF Transcript_8398/g.22418 Transcript_8398/m.22418 type:complete len:202 (+) Transcript_8398:1488-2093(+)
MALCTAATPSGASSATKPCVPPRATSTTTSAAWAVRRKAPARSAQVEVRAVARLLLLPAGPKSSLRLNSSSFLLRPKMRLLPGARVSFRSTPSSSSSSSALPALPVPCCPCFPPSPCLPFLLASFPSPLLLPFLAAGALSCRKSSPSPPSSSSPVTPNPWASPTPPASSSSSPSMSVTMFPDVPTTVRCGGCSIVSTAGGK